MSAPTTGFLATECADCGGTGRITWKQGMEQLQYSADCDDCRGTGWEIHDDTPAISIPSIHIMLDRLKRHVGDPGDVWFNHQLAGWNDALKNIGKWIQDEFQEAR